MQPGVFNFIKRVLAIFIFSLIGGMIQAMIGDIAPAQLGIWRNFPSFASYLFGVFFGILFIFTFYDDEAED